MVNCELTAEILGDSSNLSSLLLV